MTAQRYLMQIKLLDDKINNKINEREELFVIATKVTPTLSEDVVQCTHNNDKISDIVCKIVDMQNDINLMIDELVDMRKVIIGQITALQAVRNDYYNVLYKKYIEYKTLVKTASELNLSYQYVVELHGAALKTFESTYGNLYRMCGIL